MTEPLPGRWLPAYATDVRPGDLIRIGRYERRLVNRDYPHFSAVTFRAVYPYGASELLGKLDRIEVWDPDGSVAARIAALTKGTS